LDGKMSTLWPWQPRAATVSSLLREISAHAAVSAAVKNEEQ